MDSNARRGFRTEHGAEVDFIVELDRKIWAIELKASATVADSDTTGLKRFADYLGRGHLPRLWYLGSARKKTAGIDVVPWQDGLREMGR